MDPESKLATTPGLLRRLAAAVYDILLVVALLFIATFAALPLSGGEAITPASQGPAAYIYRGWLLAVAFGYFGCCWVRGGQTLGFRAWHLRLQSADGTPANWADAVVRFTIGAALVLMALAGLWSLRAAGWSLAALPAVLMILPALANLAWIPIDPAGRSLQDLAGAMRVVRTSR
jgi:uncharacterized RDD family membrane protein YckC